MGVNPLFPHSDIYFKCTVTDEVLLRQYWFTLDLVVFVEMLYFFVTIIVMGISLTPGIFMNVTFSHDEHMYDDM
jgi:hypothetical protein